MEKAKISFDYFNDIELPDFEPIEIPDFSSFSLNFNFIDSIKNI